MQGRQTATHYQRRLNVVLSFLFWTLLPTLVGAEAYCCIWSLSQTHTESEGLLWTTDRPVVETYCCIWPLSQTHTKSEGLLWTTDRPVVETYCCIWSLSQTHTESEGLLWTTDRPVVETYCCIWSLSQTHTKSEGPLWTTDRPVVETYCCIWSLSQTHTESEGLLWTTDRPVAETSSWKHTNLTTERYLFSRPRFEPATPANEPPQTHTLHRAATGIGHQKRRKSQVPPSWKNSSHIETRVFVTDVNLAARTSYRLEERTSVFQHECSIRTDTTKYALQCP
jgi:hypothetical protein